MIKDFVYAWDANKGKLKKYFVEHSKDEYCSYATVVKLLFELVVNPYLADRHEGWCEPGYNLDRIHEIDDGEYYGGTLMYLIPRNGTQPDCDDYVMTCAWYGLCETCDVTQGVYGEGGMADEGDVKCLMTLSLHLLQRCQIPFTTPAPEDEAEVVDYEYGTPKPLSEEELAELENGWNGLVGRIGGPVVIRQPRSSVVYFKK